MADDTTAVHRAVGTLLGDARQAAGLSQSEVAKRMGVAQSRIAKLELGTRRLLFVEAVDLADLYGVELARFDPRTFTTPKAPRRTRADKGRSGHQLVKRAPAPTSSADGGNPAD